MSWAMTIPCPICKTEYDPRNGSCPSCGPIPTRPGMSPGTLVPDYSIPGVKERVAAEVDFICDLDDPKRNR